MLPPETDTIDSRTFEYKSIKYLILSYIEQPDAQTIYVEAFAGGQPVVYSLPDGKKFRHRSSVKFDVATGFAGKFGASAVESFMDDIQQQIRRRI